MIDHAEKLKESAAREPRRGDEMTNRARAESDMIRASQFGASSGRTG
jgi:hypothetical protein